jgi:hypothetical protein
MVVLQYRGMLDLLESQPVIREARELAERSGDVLMRLSIESNLAVAALDAGDLEAAEAQMTRASALLGSADMDLNRFIQANNKAELALAQYDFSRAEQAYAEAASYAGVTTPAYMMDLVHAGIGLCALETGNMTEARRREQEIRSPPASWHFDPTTILAFRSRLMERRQDLRGAVDLLDAAASDLENRLVLAWLKVRALQVRLLRKAGSMHTQELATEALNLAKQLQLAHRVDEFSGLLHEAGSTRDRL